MNDTFALQVFSASGVRPTQLSRKNGEEMDDGLGMEHPIYECVTPLRYKHWRQAQVQAQAKSHKISLLFTSFTISIMAG